MNEDPDAYYGEEDQLDGDLDLSFLDEDDNLGGFGEPELQPDEREFVKPPKPD